MTTTLVLTGLFILVLTLVAVGLPFVLAWRAGRLSRIEDDLTVVQLEDSLTRSITAIRDLDFDYDMGKIEDADYAVQRRALLGRGVSILLRLDAARTQDHQLEHKIELLVEMYRQGA
ncbi:MAG: hypothetical protein HC915_06975 [Anaerolineae bacterium]|nr:hypothetical protein [Anaerolineae bacterium]